MNKINKIAAFYCFIRLENPSGIRDSLLALMKRHEILGTFILAEEGYNANIAGQGNSLSLFLDELKKLLPGEFEVKFSEHTGEVFQRRKVKLKNEIVSIRREVDIKLGEGTHVPPEEWDELIKDPETILIDTRNDYEFKIGTFEGAHNPVISKFSDLPDYIERRFGDEDSPKIATFCTGGIRCEKLVPYLKEKGFEKVFQLEGGILGYLEQTKNEEGLWRGDCFVFDQRVSVNENLTQGTTTDFSSKKSSEKAKFEQGSRSGRNTKEEI